MMLAGTLISLNVNSFKASTPFVPANPLAEAGK